eukprot:scaffold13034_cov119-Cylindrotheca_fusiformis.AAC.4
MRPSQTPRSRHSRSSHAVDDRRNRRPKNQVRASRPKYAAASLDPVVEPNAPVAGVSKASVRSRLQPASSNKSRRSHSARRRMSSRHARHRVPPPPRSRVSRSRKNWDDSSDSSSSYSEDTEANSEGKLDDRGLVVNASDLSECWSKVSLNSDEETAFERFTKDYEAKRGLFFFGNEDDISLPSIRTSAQESMTQASVPSTSASTFIDSVDHTSTFIDSVDHTYDDYTVRSDDSSGIVKRTETFRTDAVQNNQCICGLDDDSMTEERSYGGLRNNEVLIAAASTMRTYDTRGLEFDNETRTSSPVREKTFHRKIDKGTCRQTARRTKVTTEASKSTTIENEAEDDPAKAEISIFSLIPVQWWFGSEATTSQPEKNARDEETQDRIENAKRDLLVKPNLKVERSYLNARVRKDGTNRVEFSDQNNKVDLNGRVQAFAKPNRRQTRREAMQLAARLKKQARDKSISLAIATGASKAMRSQYALREEAPNGEFVGPSSNQHESDLQDSSEFGHNGPDVALKQEALDGAFVRPSSKQYQNDLQASSDFGNAPALAKQEAFGSAFVHPSSKQYQNDLHASSEFGNGPVVPMKQEAFESAFVRPSSKRYQNDLHARSELGRREPGVVDRTGEASLSGPLRGSVLPLQVVESSSTSQDDESNSFISERDDDDDDDQRDTEETKVEKSNTNNDDRDRSRPTHSKPSIHDDIQDTAFYTVWKAPTGSMQTDADWSHTESVKTSSKWPNNKEHVSHSATTKAPGNKVFQQHEVPRSNVKSLISAFEPVNKGKKVEVKTRPDTIPPSSNRRLDADRNVPMSSPSSNDIIPDDDNGSRNRGKNNSSVPKSETKSPKQRNTDPASFHSSNDDDADDNVDNELLYLGSTDYESLQPVQRERKTGSSPNSRGHNSNDYYGEFTKETVQPSSRRRWFSGGKRVVR